MLGTGGPITRTAVSKIELETTSTMSKRLTITENHAVRDLLVRATRRGMFVGCHFITYEALDELVRISNEDK